MACQQKLPQGSRKLAGHPPLRCRRAAKLRAGMSMAQRWGMPYELVHWEDMLDPQKQVGWVLELAAKYRLPLARRPAASGSSLAAGVAAVARRSERRSLREEQGGGGSSAVAPGAGVAALAAEVQPVTEDARPWKNGQAFTSAQRAARWAQAGDLGKKGQAALPVWQGETRVDCLCYHGQP